MNYLPTNQQRDWLNAGYNFAEIVGKSLALRAMLEEIQIVAPTDATVLLYGETGTGKELVARAIHNLSLRRSQNFQKVNCAAIPSELIESELFGHEKGAFTGAVLQRIGRFEAAHKGTLFFDEIGELPLALQSKLLRVLQEREFERLGSSRTIHVDVRIVVATNRDLAQMVAEQKYRSDLYYRLNVFPISLPPLRERIEDIEELVWHFTDLYARRMHKQIETIPAELMAELRRYYWPGNVRELQNVIERAVIMSRDGVLRPQLPERKQSISPANRIATTLEEIERQTIMQVLMESNWIVGGPKGAAAKLGLKRTTLISKMERLSIPRQHN